MSNEKQACKVFCGGLSWETSSERLRAYFENFGVVREAFVSYNRNNGRPRGFGFVVFESSDVADKVVATKHTIDRREVECKKAVPKEENAASSPPSSNEGGGAGSSVGASAVGGMGAGSAGGRTRKVFVGGLAPGVDEKLLRQHFEQFGAVEDAVVMYDHDNKRPRGFGFVTFAQEDSVDKVFGRGVMQSILDKQIEIKAAVPRDQMPPTATAPHHQHGRNMGPAFYESPRGYGRGGYNQQQQMQQPPFGMYGAPGYGAPPPPSREPGYGSKGPGGQQPQGPGNFANYNGGRGAGNKNMQQYMNPMGPGFGGNQRGGAGGAAGYPGTGKLPAAYDQLNMQAYMQQQQQPNSGNNHANMGFPNNTNAAALYNLTGFNPQLNNMQPSNGGGKLNTNVFNPQQIKALAGVLGVANFPPHTSGNEGYPDGTGMYGGQEEFDAATAAAAASGLSVQPDYVNFGHDTNFTTSPGPGWSG